MCCAPRRAHGSGLRWLVWVEDSENEHIYHSEQWLLTKGMTRDAEHKLAFTIPIFEPLPPQVTRELTKLGAGIMRALLRIPTNVGYNFLL